MLEQRGGKLGNGAQCGVDPCAPKEARAPWLEGVQTTTLETSYHVDTEMRSSRSVRSRAIRWDRRVPPAPHGQRALMCINNSHRLAINRERPGFPRRLRANTDDAAASIARPLALLADDGFQLTDLQQEGSRRPHVRPSSRA